jgi:hypothetical protein
MDILSDERRHKGENLADADRELLRAAETGEGLIPATPDILKVLAEAAAATCNIFEEEITELMTPERAAQVRKWRVEDGGTWRWVAGEASAAWGTDWGTNQLAGMCLCRAAAAVFGEDANESPWN